MQISAKITPLTATATASGTTSGTAGLHLLAGLARRWRVTLLCSGLAIAVVLGGASAVTAVALSPDSSQSPTADATCLHGYFPLYRTMDDAVRNSPTDAAHAHVLDGFEWWMPDGHPDTRHPATPSSGDDAASGGGSASGGDSASGEDGFECLTHGAS